MVVIHTSKPLMTPAASETTFSWVNIAPLGFPEKEIQEKKTFMLDVK